MLLCLSIEEWKTRFLQFFIFFSLLSIVWTSSVCCHRHPRTTMRLKSFAQHVCARRTKFILLEFYELQIDWELFYSDFRLFCVYVCCRKTTEAHSLDRNGVIHPEKKLNEAVRECLYLQEGVVNIPARVYRLLDVLLYILLWQMQIDVESSWHQSKNLKKGRRFESVTQIQSQSSFSFCHLIIHFPYLLFLQSHRQPYTSNSQSQRREWKNKLSPMINNFGHDLPTQSVYLW